MEWNVSKDVICTPRITERRRLSVTNSRVILHARERDLICSALGRQAQTALW